MRDNPHIIGQGDLFGPSPERPPHLAHNQTTGSIAAADMMARPAREGSRSRAQHAQDKVREFVKGRGEAGATNDEIRLETGLDIPTVCGARNRLVYLGVLFITRQKRPTSKGVLADVVAFNVGRAHS